MKDFSNMGEWTPKKLRTLRNNLNNRIESFKNLGEKAKALQPSHMLCEMDLHACEALLKKVQPILRDIKRNTEK